MKLALYPKYKDSAIEWLGEIPEGWEVKRLKYISLVRPSNVDKKTEGGETEIRLCNYIDVYNNESIDDSIDFMIASATFDEIKKFRILRGDVLITKDSEEWDDIAVPSFVKGSLETVICGYHLALVRPKSGMIDGKYLFRTFQSYIVNSQFRLSVNGITRYGLSKNSISSAVFLVPPLPEQQAIANFLDHKTSKIDELIKKDEKLIELLKEKRQAIISHAATKGIPPHPPLEKGGWGDLKLKDSGIEWIGEIPEGWEVRRLKFIALVRPSNVDKKIEDGETEVKLCNYIDVYNNEFIDDSIDFMVASATFDEIKKFRILRGDVLITKDSEEWDDIAVPSFIKEILETVLCGYHLALVRPKAGMIYGKYLFRAFESYKINSQFRISANGITRYGLSRNSIASAFFPVPPLPEQQAIANFLDHKTAKIDESIKNIQSQIEKLKEYRQTLISNVVTGKVRIYEDQ